jgi:hypothetical protein
VCGCGRRGRHRHHVVYQQELRARMRAGGRLDKERREAYARAISDSRNLVWMDFDCHFAHHNASRRLPLSVLPDSVFEFAVELMGASAAYCYLRRYYAGEDPRLDALLDAA